MCERPKQKPGRRSAYQFRYCPIHSSILNNMNSVVVAEGSIAIEAMRPYALEVAQCCEWQLIYALDNERIDFSTVASQGVICNL